jgi:ABC-2 type transport system ATP-binding protein
MFPIEVSHLRKNYGELKAVDDISFTAKEGEVFGLLGPNGAGKTTTIEIMEGLRERDGGDVKVLSLDLWKKGYQVHKKIGVIPQEFTFLEKTSPREAIIYYSDLFGINVNPDEILKDVLLEETKKTFFADLSGGQKRKTGLALSLGNRDEES